MKSPGRTEWLVLILTASGCCNSGVLPADGIELPEDYIPGSHIDRPHTLPKGLLAWHMSIALEQHDTLASEPSSTRVIPTSLGLWWGLSDNVSAWVGMPMGVEVTVVEAPHVVGGSAFLGWLEIGSDNGFVIAPDFQAFTRYRVRSRLAIETTLALAPTFRSHTFVGEHVGIAGSLRIASLVQLNDRVALRAGASIIGAGRAAAYVPLDATVTEQHAAMVDGWALPMHAMISWSVADSWDVNIGYTCSRIGYRRDFRLQVVDISLISFYP